MKLHIPIACIATLLTVATSAAAQSPETVAPPIAPAAAEERDKDFSGMIALGGAVTPKYDGASKYEFNPFGLINVKYRGIQFKAVGTSLAINVAGDSGFEFGPVIGYSSGRKVKDTEGALKLLDPIDSSLELGGYGGYHFGGNANGEGRILLAVQATKKIKSGYGFAVEPSITYAALRREKLFLSFDLGAKIQDSKAMRTTFGITPIEAARSGLAAFRPKGGISEASAGLTAGYQFTRRWGLIARAQGSTYLSHAADSPIVKDGSKSFGVLALGVSYAF